MSHLGNSTNLEDADKDLIVFEFRLLQILEMLEAMCLDPDCNKKDFISVVDNITTRQAGLHVTASIIKYIKKTAKD